MSFIPEQSIITLKTYNNSNLLQLEQNGTLAATAEPYSSLRRPNVYFYMETRATNSGNLQYTFTPYSEPEKYFAVVDGEFALKRENECTDAERLFYMNVENQDYMTFFAYTAGMTYYLYCEYSDGVLAASSRINSENRDTWFHVQARDEETVIVESEEVLFRTNLLIEKISEITLIEARAEE